MRLGVGVAKFERRSGVASHVRDHKVNKRGCKPERPLISNRWLLALLRELILFSREYGYT